ncbi:MAG: hypothetical protein B7Z37_08365 [Verrucomicrobia bacterium 12-59-8]|nr:MAG: hypothetical protein B7Z37_08365 [Verrucomicrobia bacterium 12-59-8]
MATLQQSALGCMLLEVQALSPIEFVMREFEHPAVRAGLLFFNGLREVDLRQKGFGHSIPALLASLFALNLNLRKPPRYTAAEKHPELSQAFMMILGLDDEAQFHDPVFTLAARRVRIEWLVML